MSLKNGGNDWRIRRDWNQRIQGLALKLVYPRLWPPAHYEPIPVDRIKGNPLATTIDIGGTDKIFKSRANGSLILVADRFRAYSDWENGWRDFTVREREYERHLSSLRANGMIPGVYVYGYPTKSETDFIKVYVVQYRAWLEDIACGRAIAPFLKDMRGRQENFRFMPWRLMDRRYILAELDGPLGAGDDAMRKAG